MKKRQIAAARRGSTPTEGSVHNDEHPLPRDVAALFKGLDSRSTRAAQVNHRLQTSVTETAAKLTRDQARLWGAMARQLGVSELFRDFAAARERHVGNAIKAMEANLSSAAGKSQIAARRKARTRKAKTR